ncbi:MAG: PIN domain-containing protein [Candidatus Woesearchaeota archaeon]
MNSTRIILDTNFLMIPGQYKIDIFEDIKKLINTPLELSIFKETIDELEKIAFGNTRDKANAKIALTLIKQKNLKTLKNSSSQTSYIDEIILECATENDVVCTQDKALKRLLKTKYPRIRIITLNRKLIMR